MKQNVITPLAPYTYPRCFNAQCPQAAQCLHRLAAIHDTPDDLTTIIVNPLRIPEDKSQCPAFQKAEKMQVAWGIKNLFNELPYKIVPSLKRKLINSFGRNTYYRFYRQEAFLKTDEQAFIRQLFRDYGIDETKGPFFESYSDEYIW